MLFLERSTLAGYGPYDRNCFPCMGFSGKAVVHSYSCHGRQHKHIFSGNVLLKSSRFCLSRRTFLVCARNSDGHQRNPDFSRQNKQGSGFPRGRSRPNQERDDNESLEETDFLSSKNGPLFSASSSPRFQATATPGAKEKEIVELFKKVQAQLRNRAANKVEKKIGTTKGQGERGSVDSLLKLLRKHSFEQGGRQSSISSDSSIHMPERDASFNSERKSTYFGSTKKMSEVAKEPNDSIFTRPPSYFRRKSPVPRVKYQPVLSADPSVTDRLPPMHQERRRKKTAEPDSGSFSLAEPNEQFDGILGSLPSETVDDVSEPADHEISVPRVDYGQIHLASSSVPQSSFSKHRVRRKKMITESDEEPDFVPALDVELTDDEISEPADPEISVPTVNIKGSHSANSSIPEISSLKHRGRQKKKLTGSDAEPDFVPVLNEEFEDISGSLSLGPDEPNEPENEFSEPDDEISSASPSELADLSTMKLSDLKNLAKARGIKGVSKLKKKDLLKLLQGEVG